MIGRLAKPIGKHPHVRGEDSLCSSWLVADLETPPRTWGRHKGSVQRVAGVGNTPTYVGKTPQPSLLPLACRKHPHVRGEDHAHGCPPAALGETPPRTWGRRRVSTRLSLAFRNTPTYVGKTLYRARILASIWKHPHVRGEDDSGVRRRHLLVETPPRTWGRHFRIKPKPEWLRNTPTYVGKTHKIY